MNKVQKEDKGSNLTESFVSITLGFLVVVVAGLLIYNQFSKAKKEEQASQSDQDVFEEQIIDLPTTHQVSSGEDLWKIAEKYYGSGYNWVSIAEENNITNPNLIAEGTSLDIPEADVIKPQGGGEIAAASTEAETAPDETIEEQAMENRTYTVQRGDNLWKIAVSQYGDGYAWTKIANANNLANPDIIHVGNELTLP